MLYIRSLEQIEKLHLGSYLKEWLSVSVLATAVMKFVHHKLSTHGRRNDHNKEVKFVRICTDSGAEI